MLSTCRPALLALAATLSACSQQPAAEGETANDFADRVSAGQAASQPVGPPQPMEVPATAEGKSDDPPVPPGATGLALPAGAESCNAPAAREFLNRADSAATRAALTAAVEPGAEVRFLPPGSSDKVENRKSRLNVMIDNTGTIRDLRCG